MKIRESKARKAFQIFNYTFLAVVTLTCLAPIVNLLAMSFSSAEFIKAGEVTFWPRGFTLKAYQYVIQTGEFWRAAFVSFRRVLIGVPLNLVMSILLAYPLSKDEKQFPARKYYSWFFVITMVFNGGVVPTYLLVNSMGMMDSMWALILPTVVNVFNTLVLMNFMRGLPRALEEASQLDGASQWTILLKVYLPLSKPSLATITLFNLINHWNSWYDGLLYNNYMSNYPLQTYLQNMIASLANSTILSSNMKDAVMKMSVTGRNLSAAQIFISIIPVMCIYPLLQKYFTTGLVMGSVKE